MPVVCGLDPGNNGAFAILDPDSHKVSRLVIEDMPVFKRKVGGKTITELNLTHIATILKRLPASTLVVIEWVSPMPGQGISSTGKFMFGFGACVGIATALDLRVKLIRPRDWKQAFKLPASKDAARALATKKFPRYSELFARARDDGRAESALLALYGATHEAAP